MYNEKGIKKNQTENKTMEGRAQSENPLNTTSESIKGILKIFKRKISFEEYLNATGDVIDEKIINICQEENVCFVGGSCTFRASKNNERISAKLELFFQDAFNEWIKKEQQFSAPISAFKDEAKTKFIEKMYTQDFKIDIDPPKTKGM